MANHRVTPYQLHDVIRILATRLHPTANEKIMLFACTFQLECFDLLEQWQQGLITTTELEDKLIHAVNERYAG